MIKIFKLSVPYKNKDVCFFYVTCWLMLNAVFSLCYFHSSWRIRPDLGHAILMSEKKNKNGTYDGFLGCITCHFDSVSQRNSKFSEARYCRHENQIHNINVQSTIAFIYLLSLLLLINILCFKPRMRRIKMPQSGKRYIKSDNRKIPGEGTMFLGYRWRVFSGRPTEQKRDCVEQQKLYT